MLVHVYAVHMARLIYTGNISLDGYMNDADGNFDWAEPTDEVHQFFNDLEKPIGTHVYGRRLYETMKVWETMPHSGTVMDEYADDWRASSKVVVSSTLDSVDTPRTTLERSLDFLPALKASSDRDITIGGPTLGVQALDLVDEVHLLLHPFVVGGGTPFFAGPFRGAFSLVSSRAFDNGVVHAHYRKDS